MTDTNTSPRGAILVASAMLALAGCADPADAWYACAGNGCGYGGYGGCPPPPADDESASDDDDDTTTGDEGGSSESGCENPVYLPPGIGACAASESPCIHCIGD